MCVNIWILIIFKDSAISFHFSFFLLFFIFHSFFFFFFSDETKLHTGPPHKASQNTPPSKQAAGNPPYPGSVFENQRHIYSTGFFSIYLLVLECGLKYISPAFFPSQTSWSSLFVACDHRIRLIALTDLNYVRPYMFNGSQAHATRLYLCYAHNSH